MKYSCALAMLPLLLTGCQTTILTIAEETPMQSHQEMMEESKGNVTHTGRVIGYQDTPRPMLMVPQQAYKPRYTHKFLNDYAEQITMTLMAKAKSLDTNTTLGVASFVSLNHNLQTTSVLGNQLAESFMNEIQTYGISVVDFKAMDGIEVAPNGDLVFKRKHHKDADMNYVLSGTMQQNQQGIQVNARIINLHDRVVVASAKGFIPHFIVSQLTPDYVLMN